MTLPFVQGSIAPVFTVFKEDRSIDETGQRNLLDFLLDRGGISAYFVRSGMGQMYAYSAEDVRLMTELATDHLRGRAPVMVGCSGIWDRNYDRRPDSARYTDEAIGFCKCAQDHGADAAVLTIPEGLAPAPGETAQDVVQHYFETVSAAVSLPLFAYQPPNTDPAYCLTRDSMRRLAAIPNLCGIKVSTKDAEYYCDLGEMLEGTQMALICGCETAYYAALAAGARGAIGQGTTLNPHVINAIANAFARGDLASAMRAQGLANRLCRESANPVAFLLRYANEQGYAMGSHAREESNPYIKQRPPLDDAGYARFKVLFEEAGEQAAITG